MSKLRVAVLFGGVSKDYIVSCRSAYYVIENIEQAKIEVLPVGITKAGRWLYFPGDRAEILTGSWEENPDCCSAVISPDPHHGGIIKILPDGQTSIARIDAIFPVLHGKYGECGQIQALCKLSRVPFVGSEQGAANACNDKMLTHLILDKAGIKTAKYKYLERDLTITAEDNLSDIIDNFTYPVFVKAASCSASIGANLAKNRDELITALKIAFSHHHKAIIEESLFGRELECVVYGNDYSLTVSDIYENLRDTDNCETPFIESTARFVPSAIGEELRKKIADTSLLAFKAMGCKIYAKISYKLVGNDLYCTKVCNLPGLSKHSAFTMLTPGEKPEFFTDLINAAIDSRN